MESRDYLVKRLEAFLKFLAMIMGLKEKGNAAEAIEQLNGAFATYAGLSPEEIENTSEDTFIPFLSKEKKITTEQQEQLAELLYWKGIFLNQNNEVQASLYFKKSLLLLQHLQNNSKDFSMEREARIKEIEKRITLC